MLPSRLLSFVAYLGHSCNKLWIAPHNTVRLRSSATLTNTVVVTTSICMNGIFTSHFGPYMTSCFLYVKWRMYDGFSIDRHFLFKQIVHSFGFTLRINISCLMRHRFISLIIYLKKPTLYSSQVYHDVFIFIVYKNSFPANVSKAH